MSVRPFSRLPTDSPASSGLYDQQTSHRPKPYDETVVVIRVSRDRWGWSFCQELILEKAESRQYGWICCNGHLSYLLLAGLLAPVVNSISTLWSQPTSI